MGGDVSFLFRLVEEERERMAMIAVLLMFMSPFVKEFQFSRWSH